MCCRERCLLFFITQLTDYWCPSVNTAFRFSGQLLWIWCSLHTHARAREHTHAQSLPCRAQGDRRIWLLLCPSAQPGRRRAKHRVDTLNTFILSTQNGISWSCVVIPVSTQVDSGLKQIVMGSLGTSSDYFQAYVLLVRSLWHQTKPWTLGRPKAGQNGLGGDAACLVSKFSQSKNPGLDVRSSGCQGVYTQVLESRHPGGLWTPSVGWDTASQGHRVVWENAECPFKLKFQINNK